MENKIVFCNIAWMNYYKGVTKDDKPINGGKYIKDVGTGGEVYSFLDDQGKCYGFVRINGDIALQNHFKDVKLNDPYVDNVLVVWVATNDKKETRIIGWYKNARIYRSNLDKISSTNQNKYYNITADTEDCYLLPLKDRDFEIDRASKVGKGKGFGQSNIWYAESEYAKLNIVPKVLKYIKKHEDRKNSSK